MAFTMAYTAESFVGKVRRSWGRNLLGAVVYGSAAGDDYDPKWSDINLLLVVKDMEASGTPATAKLFHKWTRGGNPPPMGKEPLSFVWAYPMGEHDWLATTALVALTSAVWVLAGVGLGALAARRLRKGA